MGTSSSRNGITPNRKTNPSESKLWIAAKKEAGKYFQQTASFEQAYKSFILAYDETNKDGNARHSKKATIVGNLYRIVVGGFGGGIKSSLRQAGASFDDSKKARDVFIDYISKELCPIGVTPEETATREETLLLSLQLYDTLFDEEGFMLETKKECEKIIENVIIDNIAKEMMNDLEINVPRALEKEDIDLVNKQRDNGLKRLKSFIAIKAKHYTFNYKDADSLKDFYDKTYKEVREELKKWGDKDE